MNKQIIIFTDGSSLGNPGPGGFGAVIAYLPEGKVIEMGEYEEKTTNNRMELTAAIESLLAVSDKEGDVIVYTDSTYLMLGITTWIHGWRKNGWKSANKKRVLNQDLWERLILLVEEREKKGKVEWKKVKGHADVLGNLRADAIATGFAEHKYMNFLHGTLAEYEKTLGGSLLNI